MSDADSPPTGPVVLASHRSGLTAWLGKPVHHGLRVRWSTVLLAVTFLGLGALYLLVPHAKRVTYYVRAVPGTTVPAAPTTTVGGRSVPTDVPAGSTTTTTSAGTAATSTTTTTTSGSSTTTTTTGASSTTSTTGAADATSTSTSSTTSTTVAGATAATARAGG